MLKLIKWLVKKIPPEQIYSLLKWIYGLLPIEDWINAVCDRAAELADKTETEIDDEFVEALRDTLLQLLVKNPQ